MAQRPQLLVLVHRVAVNPLEVVYAGTYRPAGAKAAVAVAHGCVRGHLLSGEERFEVVWKDDDTVWYKASAFSRPAHPIAAAAYPAVRALQDAFARDSMRAMVKAVKDRTGAGGD